MSENDETNRSVASSQIGTTKRSKDEREWLKAHYEREVTAQRIAALPVYMAYKRLKDAIQRINFRSNHTPGGAKCRLLLQAFKLLGYNSVNKKNEELALKHQRRELMSVHPDRINKYADALTRYMASITYAILTKAKEVILSRQDGDPAQEPIVDLDSFPANAKEIEKQTRTWINDLTSHVHRNVALQPLLAAWNTLRSSEVKAIAKDFLQQPQDAAGDSARTALARYALEEADTKSDQTTYQRYRQQREHDQAEEHANAHATAPLTQTQTPTQTQTQTQAQTQAQTQRQPQSRRNAEISATPRMQEEERNTERERERNNQEREEAELAEQDAVLERETRRLREVEREAERERERERRERQQEEQQQRTEQEREQAELAEREAVLQRETRRLREVEREAQRERERDRRERQQEEQQQQRTEAATERAARIALDGTTRERTHPTMPPPLPATHQNNWTTIDRVSVDDCHLGHVAHMEFIPFELRREWTSAYSTIINRVLTAHSNADETERNRSLKWKLAIHHVLLSNPKRGKGPGDRQYIGELNRRFRYFSEGNLEPLVDEWVSKMIRYSERKTRRPKTQAEIVKEQTDRCEELCLGGHMGRGIRAVESFQTQADMQAPEVIEQAIHKHPIRKAEHFWSPEELEDRPFLSLDCTKHLHDLDLKAGTGPTGFSNVYLHTLQSSTWNNGSPESLAVERLNKFGELYMNDLLPHWFMFIMLGVKQIGLDKKKIWDDGNTDYRFLGVGENDRRLFWKTAYKAEGHCFRTMAEPTQLALGTTAGGQTLAIGTAALMELFPDHDFLKGDLVNFFGVGRRATGVMNILNDPGLAQFHRIVNAELFPESIIYYRDKKGRMTKANHVYSEGGQQGATSSLLMACAAIQPYLDKLDKALQPFKGSARTGIDDGVVHGPPHILWPLIAQYHRELEEHCGLKINRASSMVYCPNGDYSNVPPGFTKGTVTFTTGPPGQQTEHTAEGLMIWGSACSADGNYRKGHMAKKSTEVCSTINHITQTLNPRNKDLALSVVRLSLQNRLQYFQQIQFPEDMQHANDTVQLALETAVTTILGFDINDPTSYSTTPATLADPSITADNAALPAKSKGMGLRKMNMFRSEVAFVGGLDQVAKQFIDIRDDQGNIVRRGLYPLLEPMFGAGSQDAVNKDTRWEKFIDGSSTMGTQFRIAVIKLKTMCPPTSAGPLKLPVAAIRPASVLDGKLQKELTIQIEKHATNVINARHDALADTDRRKQAFQQRQPNTMACLTTAPTKMSQVPQNLFTGCAAHILGAIDPIFRPLVGSRIGNTPYKVDLHGDTLGSANLPGDRWRLSHDAMKDQIFMDGKMLGTTIKTEVYGLFTAFMSPASQQRFNQQTNFEKKLQSIVPDIVLENLPADSPIHVAGMQMYELKRVQSYNTCNKTTGLPTGPNPHYTTPRGEILRQGANHRAAQIPLEYEAKALKTDRLYGPPGSTAVQNALHTLPIVCGLAIGVFGEFSDSIQLLIKGMAHEGALKNAAMFGTTDTVQAQSIISWWLKKRWNRLSLITAVRSRYDALRYVGGSAQAAAAERHTHQERMHDEYAQELGRRFREEEAGLHRH